MTILKKTRIVYWLNLCACLALLGRDMSYESRLKLIYPDISEYMLWSWERDAVRNCFVWGILCGMWIVCLFNNARLIDEEK